MWSGHSDGARRTDAFDGQRTSVPLTFGLVVRGKLHHSTSSTSISSGHLGAR